MVRCVRVILFELIERIYECLDEGTIDLYHMRLDMLDVED